MRKILQSERLTLRRVRPDDAKAFARLLANDRESVLMMSHMPNPCTEEAAGVWIKMQARHGAHWFAITRRHDGAFLGAIGLAGPPERPSVGYWVGRPYWGQGYATEALRLMITLACSLGATRMEAETFPGNPASERVLGKCRFVCLGLVQRNYPARGGMKNVHLWMLDLEKRPSHSKG